MQINFDAPNNAKNLGGEKETTKRMVVVGIAGDTIAELIDVRWYMGRSRTASTVYCTVWIRSVAPGSDYGSTSAGGHGKAGGHGYCKESAAFESALVSAGVVGIPAIGGAGEGAVRETLIALAKAIPGWEDLPLHIVG